MSWSPRRYILQGALVLVLGLGGFVTWSFLSAIDGAVIAPGQVVVEARRQAIQHADGGLVAALHVREGQRVNAGDALLTLDGAELSAQHALLNRELIETLARLDRLRSEVLGLDQIAYRDETREFADHAAILDDERTLFEARRSTLEQTVSQLREQQTQTNASIAGQERQLAATSDQLALIRSELSTQTELYVQGLVQAAAMRALQREEARLNGTMGELEAGIAQSRSIIAGIEIEILRQRAGFREAAQEALRALQPRENELREQRRVIETQIARLILRAPMEGRVLGLNVHTVGGVIAPGAEVASIIPNNTRLVFTVEIDPSQIDRVQSGLPARLRFPNFNALSTPEFGGVVETVSADALSEPTTGRRFYTAEITLLDTEATALGAITLQPGMPVEAYIQTGSRSPASFLLKPLTDYWAYAMREE